MLYISNCTEKKKRIIIEKEKLSITAETTSFKKENIQEIKNIFFSFKQENKEDLIGKYSNLDEILKLKTEDGATANANAIYIKLYDGTKCLVSYTYNYQYDGIISHLINTFMQSKNNKYAFFSLRKCGECAAIYPFMPLCDINGECEVRCCSIQCKDKHSKKHINN
jgi:hypothetical protein